MGGGTELGVCGADAGVRKRRAREGQGAGGGVAISAGVGEHAPG